MKKQKIKLIPLFLSLILIFTNVLPTTTINAANKTVNSIGSINNEDEHNHVGVDETQGKETVYSDEITKDETQNTLVYVSQASTFSVKIPKSIILNGEKTNDGINKGEYVVTVLGNIGGNEIVNVIPEYNFLMHQLGKNSLNANVTQDKLEWKHNEFNVLGNGVVSTNEMTAGSWNGSFTFNINLETYNNEIVFAKNKNGEDLYATTTYIIGVEKTELLNKLVESGMILNTNEIDLLINVESNSFEEYANTTINVSKIANTGDMIAIYHYDKNNEVWEFIDICKVDENGEIKTQFESFSPIALDKINSNEEHIHFYGDWQIVKNETCETNGLKEKICVVCENKEEKEIPATGHTSVNGGTSGIHTKCSVCGTTLSTAHSYTKTTIIEPTCTTKGTSKYTCNCGYSYTSQDINALEHSFKTKEVSATYLASESTCEKAATYYYKCDRCSTKGTETYVNGSANGHQYGDWETTKSATCLAKGNEKRVCSVCDKVETRETNALGHNFATTYTIDKEATCTEKGSKSQHCSRCDAKQNVTEIAALGHTSVSGGTSEIHTKCSVCDMVLSNEHQIAYGLVEQSTCSTNGYYEGTCICGYTSTKQAEIDPKNHTISNEYTIDIEPTCTNVGSKVKRCVECGTTIETSIVDSLGHNYGNATYSWTGYTSCVGKRICSRCNDIETINATITSKITSNATCTENGTETFFANFDDTNYTTITKTKSLDALGHDEIIATSPDINTHSICDRCGITLSSNHNYNYRTKTIKAATCTESGTKINYCECGYGYQSSIEPLGHTRTNGGTSDIHEKCGRCSIVLSNNHTYTKTTSITATCTQKGTSKYTCSCGYSYTSQDIEPSHNYVDNYCTRCNIQQPGLYNDNGVLIASLDELINDYGLNVKISYNPLAPGVGCLKDVMESNEELATATTLVANKDIMNSSALLTYSNIEKVIILNDVTTLKDNSFANCKYLSSVTIPNTVTSIGAYAFQNCSSLTSISIPNSVVSFGNGVFNGCTKLKTVNLSSNTKEYGTGIFTRCSSLTSIPTLYLNNITKLGNDEFSGCTSITTITIPISITSIGRYAFKDCTSLTTVIFNNSSGWYIGTSAGEKTTKLESTYVSSSTKAATYLKSTYVHCYWTR